MKAIVQDRYGSPDVLEFRDVADPVPGDNDVLVQVRAASVNAYDWHVMRGTPSIAKLGVGFGGPKMKVRGRDFAGRVISTGANVRRFQPGDDVYGDLGNANGAFAECARVPEGDLDRKPANLTYEQAAAIPLAGNTALKGLRDVARVRPGQRVLINGASGGVGTFAVQIAKVYGAEVTGVCSGRNAELVRSIGADHIVDYSRDDFTRTGQHYDVVFDLVGNRPLGACLRALTPRGTLVLSGGGVSGDGGVLGPVRLILQAKLVNPFVRRRLLVLSTAPSREILESLRELVDSGKVAPVIDRGYPLSEAAEAIRYLERDHARAKVVITV
jgi:NADPH:quinone reductase-like Zn-dependent oxidoreductase